MFWRVLVFLGVEGYVYSGWNCMYTYLEPPNSFAAWTADDGTEGGLGG